MIGVLLVTALPYTVINYAAGLTSLSWWHYVVGAAITVNAGTRSAALLDPEDPRDLEVRDRALPHFGTMNFGGIQKRIVAARI
ncbi:hypothetical protein [Arthrobacter alpinus]|uniref:hypothetical protein n=1 Tax=Arthrobacter alpinus TaxID=656366 RepID=UPI000782918B|nr:hypothetical protein [Arthrobacter alpinus]